MDRQSNDDRPQRSHSTQRRHFCLWSGLLALVVFLSSPVAAHDLEGTQVAIAFARDGSFTLDVSNDANWLKLRLEPFERTGDTRFSDRVVLFVDGHEIRPASIERIPGGTVDTYRMRGRMPTDAHTLRWYYGLVVDPYPLAIRRADGRVMVEEIAGDAWSSTIDLSGQFQEPWVSERLAATFVVGSLLLPLALRLRKRSNTKDTKDTKDTKISAVLGPPASR